MSQDIEIDPDSRTIKYYEKPTMNPDLEDIKSRALYQQGGPNPAQVLIHESDFNYLLVEVDRLRKDCEHHKQAALDISDENDRLRKLVPPETERGPGVVGQGSWSVYAEKVVAERDEARDDLNTLCEDIRCLKEENDELKEAVRLMSNMLVSKKEHANIHYGHDDFLGIDGYGPFSLKQISNDRWEIQMLKEKVTLYNKKGRRVRGHIVDGNPEGDW